MTRRRYCCAACRRTTVNTRRILVAGIASFLILAVALLAAPELITDVHPLSQGLPSASVQVQGPERVALNRVDRSESYREIHHTDYQRPRGMSEDVYWALHHASAEWNVPMSTMARVSRCESTWNPAARSRSGRYLGLFQHHRSYWRDRVRNFNNHVALHNSREPNQLEPMAGDPFAAIDNARVTAWMVAHKSGWKPWSCR